MKAVCYQYKLWVILTSFPNKCSLPIISNRSFRHTMSNCYLFNFFSFCSWLLTQFRSCYSKHPFVKPLKIYFIYCYKKKYELIRQFQYYKINAVNNILERILHLPSFQWVQRPFFLLSGFYDLCISYTIVLTACIMIR